MLAEPVVADRDFPPFARATRDGFAVRADDLVSGVATLRVVGQVRAGDSYDLPVAYGEAVEIMTGAAVPVGADAVVMVEYTERKSKELNHKGHEGPQRANTRLARTVPMMTTFWILLAMKNPNRREEDGRFRRNPAGSRSRRKHCSRRR